MIPYIHKTRSRGASFKLSIAADGTIIATTHKLVPRFLVDQFVQKHTEWIETQRAKQAQRPQFETQDSITIFGTQYKKNVTQNPLQSAGVHIEEGSLVCNVLHADSENKATSEKITQFLKNTATQYIVAKTHQLAAIMNVSFSGITLKQQKTRWGSCSSKKHLNFNWRLVHFPTPIIDYVIVHELAHLTHMDHSQKFWRLVAQFDPEHAVHRGWLKRNGMTLS